MLLSFHESLHLVDHNLLVLGETVQTGEVDGIEMNDRTALESWSWLFLAADDLRTSHGISAFCLDHP